MVTQMLLAMLEQSKSQQNFQEILTEQYSKLLQCLSGNRLDIQPPDPSNLPSSTQPNNNPGTGTNPFHWKDPKETRREARNALRAFL